MSDKVVYILLPAYNEALTLPKLFEQINDFDLNSDYQVKVVVCNDCSSDDTKSILKNYNGSFELHVLNHELNRGLGETSRDLFEYAANKARDNDYIVRMDADNTHSPLYIHKMIHKIDAGFDVVIASRFEKGGGQQGVSTYRAFVSCVANLFMKCVFPIKGVREYSCGYRCYRASIIKDAILTYGNNFIQLKGLGFTGTLEKLIKLHLIGAKVSEVPFELRYDLKDSDSKMVSSVTTLGYFTMAILYHWPWGGWKYIFKKPR